MKQLRIVAFFASISLFLASIEYLIPKPVPFFRIGIANIPILLALRHMRLRHLVLLVVLKVVGQGLVNGTLLSYVFLFSASGNAASLLVMLLLSSIPEKYLGLTGISIAGALASNIVQTLFSVYFIFGLSSWVLFVSFIVLGYISGGVLGYIAEGYSRSSTVLVLIRNAYQKA